METDPTPAQVTILPSVVAPRGNSEVMKLPALPPAAGGDLIRKPHPGLAVDLQGTVSTPYGELDRIEVSANHGMPLPGDILSSLLGLEKPLLKGEPKRVAIIEQGHEGFVILRTPEPRDADGLHGQHDEEPAEESQSTNPLTK